TRTLRAVNDADHAGAADSRLDLVAAEGAKLVGDELRGLLDIVKEPRVLMDLAAPGPGVGNEVGDRGLDRHRRSLLADRDTLRTERARCQRARLLGGVLPKLLDDRVAHFARRHRGAAFAADVRGADSRRQD